MDRHANIGFEQLEASASRAAQFLRLLGNENRLLILCQLADGELSVGGLHSLIGEGKSGLSQSALSQHLARLRDEDIVSTRREGQSIFYTISDPAALQIIKTLAGIFCPPQLGTQDEK